MQKAISSVINAIKEQCLQLVAANETMPPLLVIGTEKGAAVAMVPFPPEDIEQRERYAENLREAAAHLSLHVGGEVMCAGFVTESWMVTAKTLNGLDRNVRPSQHPDRIEAVNLHLETDEGVMAAVWPIVRTDSKENPRTVDQSEPASLALHQESRYGGLLKAARESAPQSRVLH